MTAIQSMRGPQDKKALKISYLEAENRNLQQMCEDLQTTLSINKNIIKSLLEGQKKQSLSTNGSSLASTSAGGLDYTISQLTHENEMLEANLRRVTEERDQLNARLFIMQQIIDNTKDKEEDVVQIYLDEIEELKENLERKEYLLQVNEQKYSEFEKMLMQVADYDDGVRRRLEDMNVVPKDRKISNVVLENAQLKGTIEELKYEVEKIRDQMEQMATQQHQQSMMGEELSIFQAKGVNMPKQVDLNKLHRPGESGTEYTKKLEQSVQYLNEKIQKSRIDMKNLKKEIQNLKDSNENHIFINDKLNQALKKAN